MLNFINAKGTNFNGFAAYNGGQIGLIDGVTIQAPTDGTGPLASTDSSGRHIWNTQSYGGGIVAYGAGSNISLGRHVIIKAFYYSMVADNNGGIDAPSGGVIGKLAGDVNAMARGGGVIVCTPCAMSDASDYTNPAIAVLGSNYDAERGGSLFIDGSTASGALEASVLGLTGGHIWAHNMTLSGGIGSGSVGAMISGNAAAELTGSTISGYNIGVSAINGGFAAVDGANIHGNVLAGLNADAGRITGAGATIANNRTYGIQAIHQGTVVMFETYAHMSGNGMNFSVSSAGIEPISGTAYTASSIDVK